MEKEWLTFDQLVFKKVKGGRWLKFSLILNAINLSLGTWMFSKKKTVNKRITGKDFYQEMWIWEPIFWDLLLFASYIYFDEKKIIRKRRKESYISGG